MTVMQNAPVRLTRRDSDDEFNFCQSPPRHRARSSTPPPAASAPRTPPTPRPARVYTSIPETDDEDDGTPPGRVQHRLTREERDARRGFPRRRLIASFADGGGNWTSSLVPPPTTTPVATAVVTIRNAQDREQQDWAAFPDAQPREEDQPFTFINELTWPAAREIAGASLAASAASRTATSSVV